MSILQQALRGKFVTPLKHWFDSHATNLPTSTVSDHRIDWLRVMPFILVHAGVMGIIWVGWSTTAVVTAITLYWLRMIAITGFYHRYFSHKSFHTSRLTQFIFALLGASAAQRGPLWWASHHRHHHIHSDQHLDLHSPTQHGFWWSHMGWFTTQSSFAPNFKRVPDLLKFKELVWLDRYDSLAPLLLIACLFSTGMLLEEYAPQLETNGFQMVVWGFFISTVFLYHATYTVNSLAHQFGKRRYATRDDSRNSMIIALLTCGEGWHNNHHHFPGSVRQGFYWWEIDITYYCLRGLAALGIIWNLKVVPSEVKTSRLIKENT